MDENVNEIYSLVWSDGSSYSGVDFIYNRPGRWRKLWVKNSTLVRFLAPNTVSPQTSNDENELFVVIVMYTLYKDIHNDCWLKCIFIVQMIWWN